MCTVDFNLKVVCLCLHNILLVLNDVTKINYIYMGIYKNGIESKMSGAVSHMQKSIHKFIPACLISNGIYNKKKMESTHA